MRERVIATKERARFGVVRMIIIELRLPAARAKSP